MHLIRKISGYASSTVRMGWLFTALAMLVAYPGLSFDSCPLEMKPQKSVCNCGCGCGTADGGTATSGDGASACSCGMTDREINPATPLNAPAIGSPENLSAPTAEVPAAVEAGEYNPGNGELDFRPLRATNSLYLKHVPLRI